MGAEQTEMEGLPGQSGEISRDQILVIITSTATEVKGLNQTMRELRQSVEEMVDRFTEEVESLRETLGVIPVLQTKVEMLEKRVASDEAAANEDRKTWEARYSGLKSQYDDLSAWRWRIAGACTTAAFAAPLLLHALKVI